MNAISFKSNCRVISKKLKYDSCLLVSGKNVQDIENTLSHELQNVSDWLVDNKLSLHLGKTESIIFGSHKRLKNKKELNVVCNGVKIDSKPNVGRTSDFLNNGIYYRVIHHIEAKTERNALAS